jgi:hypothetical protein
MSDRFEDLTRQFAGASTRRSLLKGLGVAVVGATAATVLKPFRAHGVTNTECQPGLAHCGDGCCPAGQQCINPSTGKCACGPANNVACGTGCCPKGDTCSDKTSITCCCPGQTPCGTSCCVGGVACIDRANGFCGCPPGTKACGKGEGTRCCPSTTPCTQSETCGTPRSLGKSYATPCAVGGCNPCCSSLGCPNGQVCSNGCCLAPQGQPCGSGSCGSGQYCDPKGLCQTCTSCETDQDCGSGKICSFTGGSGGCCVCCPSGTRANNCGCVSCGG